VGFTILDAADPDAIIVPSVWVAEVGTVLIVAERSDA